MALGSLVDSPLQQNPLAGGDQLGGLTFRQEGDMGRYVADNDPGGIAAGFSNLEDYLAAGNKLPEQQGSLNLLGVNLINPPKQEAPPLAEVYTNPVTKQLLDDFGKSDFAKNVNHMQQDHMEIDLNGLPISGNGSFIGSLMQYLKSVGKDNMVSHKNLQKFEPLAQVPGQELLGNSDPYTVNYGGMDIGPNVGNEIAVPSTPNPIQGIGLDGKPIGPGLQDLVSPATPPTPTIPKLDGTGLPEHNYTRSVQPIVTGPETFEVSTQQAPYQEQFTGFGNQLTGFGDQLTGFNDQFGGLSKQFDTINTRLNSMDEGIAGLSELLQPQQKLYNSPYSNFNFSSNSYSNPSPFGLGSLFGRRY
jgi:hypothetical protein